MRATMLVEYDTESDTDFLGIATEMKDVLDQHFSYPVTSVKPWKRETTQTLIQPPLQQPPLPPTL